jgi:hypothetical protein
MAETKKIRMKVSRGAPGSGIIRAGATVEIASFWAESFIADGSAEEVKTDAADLPAKEKGNGGKSRKSKS